MGGAESTLETDEDSSCGGVQSRTNSKNMETLEQVGGHGSRDAREAFLRPSPGIVLKPYVSELLPKEIEENRTKSRGEIEVGFYEVCAQEAHPLGRFLVRYHGVVDSEAVYRENAEGETSCAGGSSALQMNKNKYYLKLQDVTFNLSRPCVCDIKVGQRTHDELAGPKKIASAMSQYALQETVGFRICGLRAEVVDRAAGENNGTTEVLRKDGAWGKSLDDEQKILDGLRLFFRHGPSMIEQAVGRVEALIRVFDEHPRWRFYSSSVLFVYDADRPNESLQMYWIDFAHVFDIKEQDKGSALEKDNNVLYGLRSLAEMLTALI